MTLWQDCRFAIRLILKDRWFTLLAAIALALGIGVNNTVFTFVNAVLLRGLPFRDSPRIMSLNTRHVTRGEEDGVSWLDYRDWRQAARTFEDLGAFTAGTMNVSDEGHLPERMAGAWLSANTFRLLGQQPLLGRDFAPDEDATGAEPVAIFGYGMWQTRYDRAAHRRRSDDPELFQAVRRRLRRRSVPPADHATCPGRAEAPQTG
jgi:hypothetical protein